MKYYIGVEIGVLEINAGIVDKNGILINKASTKNYGNRSFSDTVDDAAAIVTQLLGRENIDIKEVKYIGIGCPGITNDKDGWAVKSYSLGFSGAPVREEMQKHFKLPVFVDNDANCAALAESMVGAAEDIDYSVLIRIGTGIGGGIIINNRIYTGFNYAGAEPGHMVIVMGGEKCICGRRGCWEAYASLPALIRQTTAAAESNPKSLINKSVNNDLSKITEFTAFEAKKLGDATGSEVFEKYLEYLAEGITNLINILMPAAVIIGGRLTRLGDNLLLPVKKLVNEKIYAREAEQPEFKLAQIGSSAVVIGAAMLGLHLDKTEL